MVPKVDSGWLKLFEQKGWVYFSLAFFFGALRYLLQNEFLPGLAGLRWLSDSSLLGAILFAILAIGAIGHRIGGLAIEYVGGWRARKATLTRLNSLSDVEHRILSYLINANCQSFDYRNDDGDVRNWLRKVCCSPLPASTISTWSPLSCRISSGANFEGVGKISVRLLLLMSHRG
jgi:hypothetical protein